MDPYDESWRHRLRYRFDNLLARGMWATLVWLGVVTLLAVLASSLLLDLFGVGLSGSNEAGWLEDFWQSLLRVLDPGTMANDTGWGRRVLALAVTIFGLLVAGTLIGIIAAGVEDRIARMRHGRTAVIESGHLVVLGAADQLAEVVRQVALGASSARPTTVVVLAEGDPAAVDRRLRAAGIDRRAVRVVLRSGDPTVQADLRLIRPGRARGIVVLHDDRDDDATAIRTVLALRAVMGGSANVPTVVEVRDPASADRLVGACGPWVHPLHAPGALARSAAFALRGGGLGPVLAELLQVGGVDLQVQDATAHVGTSFGDLVLAGTSQRPIGVFDSAGRLELHPVDERTIGPGEDLVTVGRATQSMGPPPRGRDREGPSHRGRGPTQPRQQSATIDLHPQVHDANGHGDRVLVVGWNRLGARLLAEHATTARDVVVEVVLADNDGSTAVPHLPDPTPLTVVRPTSLSAHLDGRDGLDGIDTVVLLPDADQRDPADADTRTLLDLGVVRRRRGARLSPRIVVQVLDVGHVPLVGVPGRDDWVIEPGASARLLVQLVHVPRRRDILRALYDDRGPNIATVTAASLGLAGDVDVRQVVERAHVAGLLALGWWRAAPDGPELVLAPSPDRRVDLAGDDRVVVVT